MKLSDLKNLNKVEYYNSEILGEPELNFDELRNANFQLFRNNNINFIQFINIDNKKVKLNNAFVITFEVEDITEDVANELFHKDFVKGSDLIKHVFENENYEYEYVSRSGTNFQIKVSKVERSDKNETTDDVEKNVDGEVEQNQQNQQNQQNNKSKFGNKNGKRFDSFR